MAQTQATSTPEAARAAPEILIVGDQSRSEHIELAFQKTDALITRQTSVERGLDFVRPATVAVLLVDPLPQVDLHRALALFRSREGHEPAVFAVVDENFSDEDARRLYDEGAAVVFEWPSEVLLMPRMIMEISELALRHHVPEAGDEALHQAVQARLQVADGIGAELRASVVGGTAVLQGQVDSLWKRQRVESILSHVPGIQGIDLRKVQVRAPEREDQTLEQHVRDVVTSAANVDAADLTVSVHDGRVTLSGSIRGRQELDRLTNVIANVEGVRAIDNQLSISRTPTDTHGFDVKRLQDAIASEFPDLSLRISAFGDVVVLSGRVPLLGIKRDVERLVRDLSHKARVVNKLHVDAPRGR